MNRHDVFEWCKREYGTEADFPWGDENAVLRHLYGKKWYGAVLTVRREKLGLKGEGVVDVLNLKCAPALIGSLRSQNGFFPAYHMNKEHWISVLLGAVPADEIKSLIALSYELTSGK